MVPAWNLKYMLSGWLKNASWLAAHAAIFSFLVFGEEVTWPLIFIRAWV
jgi:hypothetical protein